jgi:hypothetical protein
LLLIAAINLNSKNKVLRDKRSFFTIKSLRIDRVGKLFRLYPESIIEVKSRTRIKKSITTYSNITKSINLYYNPVLTEYIY